MTYENYWGFAAQHPDNVAIIEADESRTSQREFLSGINQLSHGLQSLGLKKGDSIAAMLPNSREAMEVYLAMQQIGLYLTPINFHLVGPEIAYILTDCEAQVFVVHERYVDVAEAAIQETGFARDKVFVVGAADVEGVRTFADLKAGQPTSLPEDRELGLIMN